MRDETSTLRNAKPEKHILTRRFNRKGMELGNNGHLTGIPHIDKILYGVNTKLTSVLASLILSRSYDEFYNLKVNEHTEDVLGQVIYRESENSLEFINKNAIIKEFLANDINKFFGLNVKEYLDLTRPERIILVKNAKDKMEQLEKVMEEIEKEKNKINKY